MNFRAALAGFAARLGGRPRVFFPLRRRPGSTLVHRLDIYGRDPRRRP